MSSDTPRTDEFSVFAIRRDFEDWFESDSMPLESDWFRRDEDARDLYDISYVQHAWNGYQAGRKHAERELAALRAEYETAVTTGMAYAAEAAALRAERDRLREALRPFATYAKKRAAKPFAGLDDLIHTIHAGTEWEAELRLSHCEAARRALGEE